MRTQNDQGEMNRRDERENGRRRRVNEKYGEHFR